MKHTLTIILLLLSFFSKGQTIENRIGVIITTDSGSYWLKDSTSTEWRFPNIKDTLATLKSLLNSFKRCMITESIFFKERDSSTRKAYQIATRWANVCKWLCEERGISQSSFLSMLRRKGYSDINLHNKKPPRKRKA